MSTVADSGDTGPLLPVAGTERGEMTNLDEAR